MGFFECDFVGHGVQLSGTPENRVCEREDVRFGIISSLACPARLFVSERASGCDKVYLGSLEELARSRLRGNTQLIMLHHPACDSTGKIPTLLPTQRLRFAVTHTEYVRIEELKTKTIFTLSLLMFTLCAVHSIVRQNKRTDPRTCQSPTLNPSQPRHPRVLRAPEVTETTNALPSTDFNSPSSSIPWPNYENMHVQCAPDAK